MIFLGIIHCQILEGKYSEAKQQIEFQNEVQTSNAAVREDYFLPPILIFIFLGTCSFKSSSS